MRVILKPGGLLALATLLVVILSGVYMLGQVKGTREREPGARPQGVANASPRPMPQSPGRKGNLFPETGGKFYTEKGAVATQTPLSTKDAPAQPAFRFDIQKVDKEDWNIGYNQKVLGASFNKGDKVRLSVWARSTDKCLLTLIMQKDAPPFPHCWKVYLRPTPEWKQYSYEFQTDTYGNDQTLVNCFMGTQAGTVELAGFTLERIP